MIHRMDISPVVGCAVVDFPMTYTRIQAAAPPARPKATGTDNPSLYTSFKFPSDSPIRRRVLSGGLRRIRFF